MYWKASTTSLCKCCVWHCLTPLSPLPQRVPSLERSRGLVLLLKFYVLGKTQGSRKTTKTCLGVTYIIYIWNIIPNWTKQQRSNRITSIPHSSAKSTKKSENETDPSTNNRVFRKKKKTFQPCFKTISRSSSVIFPFFCSKSWEANLSAILRRRPASSLTFLPYRAFGGRAHWGWWSLRFLAGWALGYLSLGYVSFLGLKGKLIVSYSVLSFLLKASCLLTFVWFLVYFTAFVILFRFFIGSGIEFIWYLLISSDFIFQVPSTSWISICSLGFRCSTHTKCWCIPSQGECVSFGQQAVKWNFTFTRNGAEIPARSHYTSVGQVLLRNLAKACHSYLFHPCRRPAVSAIQSSCSCSAHHGCSQAGRV